MILSNRCKLINWRLLSRESLVEIDFGAISKDLLEYVVLGKIVRISPLDELPINQWIAPFRPFFWRGRAMVGTARHYEASAVLLLASAEFAWLGRSSL
jgi:hypothetical protein